MLGSLFVWPYQKLVKRNSFIFVKSIYKLVLIWYYNNCWERGTNVLLNQQISNCQLCLALVVWGKDGKPSRKDHTLSQNFWIKKTDQEDVLNRHEELGLLVIAYFDNKNALISVCSKLFLLTDTYFSKLIVIDSTVEDYSSSYVLIAQLDRALVF